MKRVTHSLVKDECANNVRFIYRFPVLGIRSIRNDIAKVIL